MISLFSLNPHRANHCQPSHIGSATIALFAYEGIKVILPGQGKPGGVELATIWGGVNLDSNRMSGRCRLRLAPT